MRRGDVYWADLTPRSGSEQRGRRPVLIISHDGFNLSATWRSVIVIPITTSGAQARRGPTAVVIPVGEGGLDKPSIALCHQITTLDRSKLTQYSGAVSQDILRLVEAGLQIAVGIVS